MNYILIVGAQNDGKSNTIDGVCKKLNPTKIQRLDPHTKTLENSDITKGVLNGTYIIEVKGKIILIVAGTPTEQKIRITIIIQVCIELNIKIDFAIVTMRTFETKYDNEANIGFMTRQELKEFGECILETRIYRIEGEGDTYKQTTEWKERIEKIANLVNANI